MEIGVSARCGYPDFREPELIVAGSVPQRRPWASGSFAGAGRSRGDPPRRLDCFGRTGVRWRALRAVLARLSRAGWSAEGGELGWPRPRTRPSRRRADDRRAAEPSFDVLRWHDEPWTAQLALDLLPETNGPKVEVLSGSVIVTPHAGYDHQDAELDLAYHFKQAARTRQAVALLETNVVSGEDLFIPDIVVLRVPGGGRTTMDIRHAVLLGEVVSPGNRRKDIIDRPREYGTAGVPFFLRVDLRNRVPTIALFELIERRVPTGRRRCGRDAIRDAGAVRVLHRSGRPARRGSSAGRDDHRLGRRHGLIDTGSWKSGCPTGGDTAVFRAGEPIMTTWGRRADRG